MKDNEMYLQQAELYIDNINYMLAKHGRRYSYSIRYDELDESYSIAGGKIYLVSEGLRSMRYKDVIIYHMTPRVLYNETVRIYRDIMKIIDAQDN